MTAAADGSPARFRKMRVLLLNARLSDRGGADRWLLGVLARLQGDVETLLAVGHVRSTLPDAERRRVGEHIAIKGLDRTGLGRPAGPGTLLRLTEAVERFAPDVIHANDISDPGLLEMIAESGLGVLTVQDHRFFCPGRGKADSGGAACEQPLCADCLDCFEDRAYGRTMLELTRRRLAAAGRMKRLTVLSRYMARQLAAAGVPEERIVRIPPFVDNLEPPATQDAGEGKFHLLAGRLSEHKGIEVALDAAGRLGAGLPLVVAGDGPLAGLVADTAAGGRDGLRFAGWLDRPRLAGMLAGARSLWLPSVWAEPFGIVGLEALAMGVPVIASRTGGVTDWLVDGHNGLLVEPGSASELARAADRLAGDAALARRLGRAGRQMVERKFDSGEQLRLLLDVYSGFTRQTPA